MKNTPNLPPLPKPEEVIDFPHERPRAIISRKSANSFYVVERNMVEVDGKRKRQETVLGRIIDGRYYAMEDYHRLFHSNKRKVGDIEPAVPTRKYVRHKPLTERRRKDGTQLPLPETIENFPFEVDGARLLQDKKVLYVVTSTFYKTADGRRREDRRYLGRVVEGRFYTTDEYRALFKRDGTRRQPDAQ